MKVIFRIALFAALISAGRFAVISFEQLRYPGDIIFEGPGVNTAMLLKKGVNIYSKEVYDAPPFNLTLYTPLYYAAVSAAPGFLANPFLTGRCVSLAFTGLALCVLFGSLLSKDRWRIGFIGAGWLLMFSPVDINATLFRMDLMALFLSAGGLTVLQKFPLNTPCLMLSACLFGLGILSKQSYIAAPLAGLIYLAWRSPRHAALFGLFLSAGLGVSFYWLNAGSDGGFLWCVLKAPQNPFRFDQFLQNWLEMDTASFYVLILLSNLACLSIIRGMDWPARLNAIYFLASWIWLAASIGKLGASTNYFIEPIFASVWAILVWADRRCEDMPAKKIIGVAVIGVIAAFLWDSAFSKNAAPARAGDWRPTYDECLGIQAEMKRLKIPARPKILNLATNRVSLSVGWDLYLNDPFLYAILWNTGTLSNLPLVTALDQGYFDAVVLERGVRPESIAHPSPLGEIYMKIFERYEFITDGAFAYYLPRRSAGPPA